MRRIMAVLLLALALWPPRALAEDRPQYGGELTFVVPAEPQGELEVALDEGRLLHDTGVSGTVGASGVLLGLQPPDPPRTDGVVTLRVPDEGRDAASLRHFADPEIVLR